MIRALYRRIPIGISRQVVGCRYYSHKPILPKYKKGGNILVNSLNYVKEVDQYQKHLEDIPSTEKSKILMKQIEDHPELLYILAVFHYELSRIGINQANDPAGRAKVIWKYRLNYMLKYLKIHNIFWEQCQYLNIAQQSHSLNFNSADLGILDPSNFDEDTYNQLQSGKYNDTSFKDMKIISFSKPPFERKQD